MSHKAWIVVVLVAFVIAVGAALLVSTHPVAPEAKYPEPIEVKDLSGKSIYVSGEYGFTFVYASRLSLTESEEEIGEGMRVSVIELSDGEAELRIETDASAECESVADAERVEIGGAAWTRFPFGTDTAYEASHDGRCLRALMRGTSAALDETLQSITLDTEGE